MNLPRLLNRRLLVALLLLAARTAVGQVQITGTIYDESQRFAMSGVSVLGTSGIGTMTDSVGHYIIRLPLGDSIYFSYLGKTTNRFPVKDLAPDQPFNMALAISVDSLPAAFVRGKNYLLDSLATRKEYAKVFDYHSKYVNGMKTEKRGGMGIGLNLDMFFNGKENRRMEAFQKRLVEDEHDNYVDHKFSRSIVRKITGLEPPALDTFMCNTGQPMSLCKVAVRQIMNSITISRIGGNFLARPGSKIIRPVRQVKTALQAKTALQVKPG